ncbi:MAG: Dabb family protein [Chitinivibrionales bacterium]|nr:Dabb family protein [Chitinivibrionales bacterium]
MIKHIVLWKLKDEAQGNTKATNAHLAKEKLEALGGKIPGLLKIEAGIDFNQSAAAYDVALYSELESRAALAAYQSHPEHVAVKEFIQGIVAERCVVDYEL